jgi:hypothetical protein
MSPSQGLVEGTSVILKQSRNLKIVSVAEDDVLMGPVPWESDPLSVGGEHAIGLSTGNQSEENKAKGAEDSMPRKQPKND